MAVSQNRFKYFFTELADGDLEIIFDYTLETWGEIQTSKYLKKLNSSIQLLADNPRIGKPCDNFFIGCRKLVWEEYSIFYTIDLEKQILFVARILANNLDVDSIFRSDT